MFRQISVAAALSLSAAALRAQDAPAPAPVPVPPPPVQEPATGFTFEAVRALAREKAAEPWKDQPADLAPFWANMGYADHRKIQFRRGNGTWNGTGRGFELEYFHPGWVFPKTVQFSQVVDEMAVPIEWNRDLFDYRDLTVPEGTPAPGGYAGFRILAPLNGPDQMDELAVFLGGSYFRSLAPGLDYGLSARALALNTARPQGEEFPAFTQWWVNRPEKDAREIKAWALLDGPSVSGAYQFRIRPGRATSMEIEAELIFRQDVELIGIAPFSTMMWHSEFTQPKPADYRPEAHDSDGLLIHFTDREAVWRPLDNSKTIRHSVFGADKFLGFGLAQRDRDFASYQDLDANYQKRPSVWIEPVGQWPAGRINLIEQPADTDATDNVTVFWQPKDKPVIGEPFRIAYRIQWLPDISVPGLSKVLESRRAALAGDGEEGKGAGVLYVVDFAPAANPADDDGEPELAVEVGSGATVAAKRVRRNPSTGGWRAEFQIRLADATDSAEIACRLLKGGRILSEKWSALWKR